MSNAHRPINFDELDEQVNELRKCLVELYELVYEADVKKLGGCYETAQPAFMEAVVSLGLLAGGLQDAKHNSALLKEGA